MITLQQVHEERRVNFPISSLAANGIECPTLSEWIKANTYRQQTIVSELVAGIVAESKVDPSAIVGAVYSCYRAEEYPELAGMFMVELRKSFKDGPKAGQSEHLAHIALRTMIVNGQEHIVFGTDYDIKHIDLSEFSKGHAASTDDLRMWMATYRGDGSQGDVLFNQLRDFLKRHNLTPQQVDFIRGGALRHPREGRGGLIKLTMRPKGVEDMALAKLRIETSYLSFDQRQILSPEGFKIEPTRLLFEMNTPLTPNEGEAQIELNTEPAQEAEMALESNDTNQATNEAAGETKAAEAQTPQQGPDKAQQQAPRMGGFMGEAMRAMGGAVAGQKSDSDEVEYSKIEASGRQPVWAGIEWLKNNTGNEELARTDYFDKLIANLLKLHDVEADLVEIAFAPSKHASLLGTKSKHTDDISSELGIVDMAVLVPVAGQPIHVRRVGTLLSFTTTAQWEHHVRIGTRERQQEGILYLTNPDMRQTHCLAVNKADASPFGMTALEVLMQTRQDRELMMIEKLWHQIKRRAERALEQDRRLASQVVIKLERIASPILRSNHMLELGLIKGKVYSPGADSKLLFGFEVRTELESINQGALMEVVSDYEVDQPKSIPAPIFQPLSQRNKPLGGKTVDVGSAANPIPDTQAPKTDAAKLFKGYDQSAGKPEVIRQDWHKGPRMGETPAINMMQAGKSLRYVELLGGDVVGFDEFVAWVKKNLPAHFDVDVAKALTEMKVSSSHFFEVVNKESAKLEADARYPGDCTPGIIRVRAFDPDIANSEVWLSLITGARFSNDSNVWQERILQIALASAAVMQGHSTPQAQAAQPVAELNKTTCFDTDMWVFFNHAMGGISELIDDDDDARDRVRDAVRYIDRLYHFKGVNTERYEVVYNPETGALVMRVVEERNNKKVIEIMLQTK